MINLKFSKIFKDPRTNWRYILIVVILSAIVGAGILVYQFWWAQKEERPPQIINEELNKIENLIPLPDQEKEEFCGSSTYGSCNSNSDCVVGGCSGQVCQSKNEESIISTCEYRDCYDKTKYELDCKCLDNKCQWSK